MERTPSEEFATRTSNRKTHFSLSIPATISPLTWTRAQMLMNPANCASISTFEMRSTTSITGSRISYLIHYRDIDLDGIPTFCASDEFELLSAVSCAIRAHYPVLSIVCDDTGWEDGFSATQRLQDAFAKAGEELFFFQQDGYKIEASTMQELGITSYIVEFDCFDTRKETNDLSCYLAAEAAKLRRRCATDRYFMEEVFLWLRKHVQYRDTGSIADHSAVGLVRNGTAVCQGIAAVAGKMLSFGGMDARYVRGTSGISSAQDESHGWNMVRSDGIWQHIDYTHTLATAPATSLAALFPSRMEFGKTHKWDHLEYSDERSDEMVRVRQILDYSVFTFVPNGSAFSVNGCIVDTSNMEPMCLNDATVGIIVNIFEIISMLGGAYVLEGEDVRMYVGTDCFTMNIREFLQLDGAFYLPLGKTCDLGFRAYNEEATKVVVQRR